MNIEKIFSTEERVKILEHVIYLENRFGVNEIAKMLGLSKGLISKYFGILVKELILKKKKGKFIVNDNNLVKSLKIMLNVQKINTKIFKKYKFIRVVGLYGSCVKGINTISSDIDLWVKVKKVNDKKMAELTSELRKKLENIKVLILDDKKIELLKKKDSLFYHSLYFGSIILYGEEDEI